MVLKINEIMQYVMGRNGKIKESHILYEKFKELLTVQLSWQ